MGTVTWDDFARLASAPVAVALRGRVASADEPAEQLLFAPPDVWRVEDDQGRLLYLQPTPATTNGVNRARSRAFRHDGPATGTPAE